MGVARSAGGLYSGTSDHHRPAQTRMIALTSHGVGAATCRPRWHSFPSLHLLYTERGKAVSPCPVDGIRECADRLNSALQLSVGTAEFCPPFKGDTGGCVQAPLINHRTPSCPLLKGGGAKRRGIVLRPLRPSPPRTDSHCCTYITRHRGGNLPPALALIPTTAPKSPFQGGYRGLL